MVKISNIKVKAPSWGLVNLMEGIMDQENDRPATPVSDFMRNIMDDDANGNHYHVRRKLALDLEDFGHDGNLIADPDQELAERDIVGELIEQG